RLADEKRQVPSHPHGVKAGSGGHGALQRFEYLGEGHDTRPLVVAIPKVVAKKVGNLLNYLESVLHRAEVRLVVTGAIDGMDMTAGDLAKRWGVSRTTASDWMRQFRREKLIMLERGRGRVGNRLLARAAPAAPKAAITH